MAFNLEAMGACDVFYIVCDRSGENEQRVYNAFETRSEAFRLCFERDMTQFETGTATNFTEKHLYLYGFLLSALTKRSTFAGPAWRPEVVKELEERQRNGLKPCVFFLDEFPRVDLPVGSHLCDVTRREREKYLRMMRNVFRSLAIGVVISSTNGTARNLHLAGERSRGESDFRWCTVFPSLPAVLPNHEMEKAPVPDQLKKILKHSRPLFVKITLEYVREKPFNGEEALLDYVDQLAGAVACRMRRLKKRSKEFELGQLCLFRCTSFKVVDENENLIDSHLAQLEESDPFDLFLNSDGTLLKDNERWELRSVFPPPQDDLLLHLAMTGGRHFRPLEQPLHVMMQSRYFMKQFANFKNTSLVRKCDYHKSL